MKKIMALGALAYAAGVFPLIAVTGAEALADSVACLTVEAPSGGDPVVGFAKKELLRVLKGVEGRIVLREEKGLKPQQWRLRSEADGTLVFEKKEN